MNIAFVIDGDVVTPELNGSILAGITGKSVIELVKSWGKPMIERRISIRELADLHKAGKVTGKPLSEAACSVFGMGTAPLGAVSKNALIGHYHTTT
jgi:branched-chain amino acid aminotransferase